MKYFLGSISFLTARKLCEEQNKECKTLVNISVFFLLNPSQVNKTELLDRLDTLDSYSADRLITFVQTLIKINEREKLVRYISPKQKKRKRRSNHD